MKEYRIGLRDELILSVEDDYFKKFELLDFAEKINKDNNQSDALDKIIFRIVEAAIDAKKQKKKKKDTKRDTRKNRLIFTFMFLYNCLDYIETRKKLEYHNSTVQFETVKRYGRDVVNAILDFVKNNDQLKREIRQINAVKSIE